MEPLRLEISQYVRYLTHVSSESFISSLHAIFSDQYIYGWPAYVIPIASLPWIGFECVVKQLQMVLYKPDCDCNDYELPNGKATPSIIATEVWLVMLHVGWAIHRIPYYTRAARWLVRVQLA